MDSKAVSAFGPLPKMTRPRRSEVNGDVAARGIVDCKFCAQSFKRCDHALRHVKAKHTLEQVSMYGHCETVANSPDDGHITGLFTKHPTKDAKYCHGYCWDCQHWIPGVSMLQLLAHECKTRKKYERKAPAATPPPISVAKSEPDSDNEAEEDDGEQEKWDDVRDTLAATLRRHTAKWDNMEKTRVMSIVHKALGESDAMMGCSDLIRSLADLTRSPAAAAATISPAPAATAPAPPSPPTPQPAAAKTAQPMPSKPPASLNIHPSWPAGRTLW